MLMCCEVAEECCRLPSSLINVAQVVKECRGLPASVYVWVEKINTGREGNNALDNEGKWKETEDVSAHFSSAAVLEGSE